MLGFIYTAVLICSSVTMALAVHSAASGNRTATVLLLLATMIIGALFLGIKFTEYAVACPRSPPNASMFHRVRGRTRGVRRLCILTHAVSLTVLSQTASLVPGSTEPRIQLTGDTFQISSGGRYFTDAVPGHTLSEYGVLGTDLGTPMVYPDKIVFLFGDTLATYVTAGQYYLAAGSGAVDSIGYIPNIDLSQCHYISMVDTALTQGNTPSASPDGCPSLAFYENPKPGTTDHIFAATAISGLQNGEDLGAYRTPSGAFDYNGRLYMFFIVKEQGSQPHFALESILARADHATASWNNSSPPAFTRLFSVSTHPAIADPSNPPSETGQYGKFMFDPVVAMSAADLAGAGIAHNLPPSLQSAPKVVFVFGSSWWYNRSNLYLAAFSADDVEKGTSVWYYYAGQTNGVNNWGSDEKAAAPLLNGTANIGNHSVVWNGALHKFILMSGNVSARFADAPWGPWSDPILVFGAQSPWGMKLVHHPGLDAIARSVVPIYDAQSGQVADLGSDAGLPYAPNLIDQYTQNHDGSVTVFYVVSTWNPYEVFLMSSTFQLGVHGGALVSAADFDPAAVSAGAIATIFAQGLSDTAFAASSTALPALLGGKAITVQDSTGVSRMAGLYYVGPSQINFVIPPGTSSGPATVSVTEDGATILSLATRVSPVAPAFFSMNGNGKGAAAGFLLTVDPNNNTATQKLFSCSSAGACVTNPVDIGSAGSAYLELFGTGLRNVSSPAAVTATIAGVRSVVTYAGPQNTYEGEDQVNIRVPTQLRGRGLVDVLVTVEGKSTNTVQIFLK